MNLWLCIGFFVGSAFGFSLALDLVNLRLRYENLVIVEKAKVKESL